MAVNFNLGKLANAIQQSNDERLKSVAADPAQSAPSAEPQALCEYCNMPSLRSCPRCSQAYKRVKLLRQVNSDFPYSNLRAPAGEYDAQINRHGAVSVVIHGSTLGVKPGEFTFICDCRVAAQTPEEK